MRRQGLFLRGLQCTLVLVMMVALVCVEIPLQKASAATLNLTQYVNPFIGTTGGGDTFPGAAYPTGMFSWSPDNSNNPGGYDYTNGTIKEFSLTHFSGRGCNYLQDIPFMPYVGSTVSSSAFSHSSEVAQPGYYKVHLTGPNVTVELTVTAHTGLGQFTYPASTSSAMNVNAGGGINGDTNAVVNINSGAQELTGQATSTVGCGSPHYTIYFAAYFDRPFTHTSGSGTSSVNVTFDTTSNQVVHSRVGISFVSIANAESNLATENPNFDFAAVHTAADAAWNARLNTIQVQGGSSNEKIAFYSALYHTFFHPNIFSDVNGQYLGFDNKVHTVASGHAQYENITGWDNFRSLIPLLSIISPTEMADIAQSLVNDALQGDGHLPRWEQANADSHGMNGDPADIEVATAYLYGDTNFDATSALNAMINAQSHIREGLSDYNSRGYVAAGTTGNSADITQEYTNDDFAISRLALALGNNAAAATALQKSGNWQNLFYAPTKYIFPRNSDGSWASTSPTSGSGFQETDAAQLTWMETFNLRGLFDKLGGNAAVVSRLDTFFTRLNDGTNSQYAYMGNEPSEATPWAYDFAGAPSHTQNVIRRIEQQLFTNTPGGLPGNDDAGALSSWFVFACIGLYPDIPAVPGFVIGSPLFTGVTLNLPGGKTLQINAPAASDTTQYVQSMTLNGQSSTSLWLPWQSVSNGVTLGFTLGSSATSWGSNPADAPPSFPATASLQSYNSEGISSDANTASGNFDGGGNSYSNDALSAAGFNSGASVTVNGMKFQWPTVTAGADDNWQAVGQTIALSGSGSTLAFLGAAQNGPSSGTATITYTDNSTQTFTLAFSDWTLNHSTSQIIAADSSAVHMTYRNASSGKQARDVYVFYTSVALQAGKTPKSVTLPASTTQGSLHVFSVSVG